MRMPLNIGFGLLLGFGHIDFGSIDVDAVAGPALVIAFIVAFDALKSLSGYRGSFSMPAEPMYEMSLGSVADDAAAVAISADSSN